ncbi:MAG: BatE, TRP domain containing protein [Candidatus Magnetoglobus multicellularis str. Araruama]|uniref:BatE, TRP domain containing protein n=1 Tax=Candidatus Magnetoglobus multicellularis str. Araruama TaxID=890399 RepID=A0A1V1P8D7_9BACT|nr:MAG: BatE, TRP domain containing protein [Candidatus Magnetoglobus multicellularis str. Araruama]
MAVLLIGIHQSQAKNGQRLNDFVQANEAYANGDYQKAIDKYQAVIKSGKPTGSLYFNLGNCYYRMDQIGWAILYYERAMHYIPGDPDLLFNLQHARSQVEDQPEKITTVPLKSTLDRFSLSELFWLMMFSHIGFWGILIVRRFHRSEWSYYTFVGLSILWAIFLVAFSVKWYDIHYDNRGIVVSQKAIVRAGPHETETALFELHAGSIVGCERCEGNWRLVQFASGKRGWAKMDDIMPVRKTGSVNHESS